MSTVHECLLKSVPRSFGLVKPAVERPNARGLQSAAKHGNALTLEARPSQSSEIKGNLTGISLHSTSRHTSVSSKDLVVNQARRSRQLHPTDHTRYTMVHAQQSVSRDFIAYATRKRVGQACDRCRLKKNKCEGISQCSRCKTDNAICTFGCVTLCIFNLSKADMTRGHKRPPIKVYPKGYAEKLERQQTQLVTAMQELYNRLVVSGAWEGAILPNINGLNRLCGRN